jgi:hypothetical protein
MGQENKRRDTEQPAATEVAQIFNLLYRRFSIGGPSEASWACGLQKVRGLQPHLFAA